MVGSHMAFQLCLRVFLRRVYYTRYTLSSSENIMFYDNSTSRSKRTKIIYSTIVVPRVKCFTILLLL